MCSVHTRTLSIIFSEFGTNVSVKLSKLLPTPSDKHFVGKQFFLKYFFIVLDFGRYIFLTDDNFIVAKLSKLFSTTSAENFDKKFLLKNTSSFFSDREHFLFWLSAKFLQRIVQTPFYVFRKPFGDANFFDFLFLVHIQILSKICSDIRHKLNRKVVKTAFSIFRRTGWWKVFFRKVLQSIIGLWANHFLNLGDNFTEI